MLDLLYREVTELNSLFPEKDIDMVQTRKILSDFRRKSQISAKQTKCLICGKDTSSFCNSHSVPRFVLHNVAKDGKVINAAYALELDFVDQADGIKRSGTFYLICNECDRLLFADYENELSLLELPGNLLLAEIDVKDALLQISKRHYEIELYSLLQKEYNRYENKELLDTIHELDLRDYMFDYRRAKKIINKRLKSGYIITYTTLLPYVVPIAAQTGITLIRDLNGNIVNDIYDTSPTARMQTLHICIFPLSSSTRVIIFHHRDDRNYIHFDTQFSRLDSAEKLRLVNYLLFEYSENYFASPTIKNVLSTDENLKRLCEKNGDLPNLGFVNLEDIEKEPDTIPIEKVPNFLSVNFKLR